MPLKFTLPETLAKLNLTEHKLAKEANVRPATVYSICKGEAKTIKLETLESILEALNKRSPFKEITIEDVIKYEKE